MPVDQVPVVLHIFRPRIPAVDVVGVFPDITGQKRMLSFGSDGCLRIGTVLDGQLSVCADDEPGPS